MSGQCIRGSRVEQVFCSAPWPLVRRRGETRLDRVGEDVLDGVAQVIVVTDDGRREAIAEEMAAAAVTTVELLRVNAVHALHAV
jgi:hypothetical protein